MTGSPRADIHLSTEYIIMRVKNLNENKPMCLSHIRVERVKGERIATRHIGCHDHYRSLLYLDVIIDKKKISSLKYLDK